MRACVRACVRVCVRERACFVFVYLLIGLFVCFPVNICFTQLGLGIKPDQHLKTLASRFLVFFSMFHSHRFY